MKGIQFILLLSICLPLQTDRAVHWLSPTEHDFGDIPYQEIAKHTFHFKNTSGVPLVIDNIRPSCGCTAVDWEEIVIEPDSVGYLQASYDAHMKGYFRKSMKVYFNGQRKAEKLWLEGYVIE